MNVLWHGNSISLELWLELYFVTGATRQQSSIILLCPIREHLYVVSYDFYAIPVG